MLKEEKEVLDETKGHLEGECRDLELQIEDLQGVV